MNISWVMSTYLTVLMTLERFNAIVRKKRPAENQKKVKLIMTGIFFLTFMYNIPKMLEYTWKSTLVRQNYDLDESIWTNIDPLSGLSSEMVMKKFRGILETGASHGEYLPKKESK